MHLVIISHTEHYRTPEGTLVGWGPTVTELNHLAKDFERITHVAMEVAGAPPPSALPYTASNIHMVALPKLGGPSVADKLKLIGAMPQVLYKLHKQLKQADVFQFRAPTGIGVYVIPYLIACIKTTGWFKYAGNWNQQQPPWGYRWQRWWLKRQSRTVTINGQWPDQPKHCLSFENPCLTEEDLQRGAKVAAEKDYTGPLELCYVGRLERPKGVGRILDALKQIDPALKSRIQNVHLVGEGDERSHFEALANSLDVQVHVYGALPREQVFQIFERCHYLLLPTTASEGFPKVLAEASNMGCIPITSKVSAIGHYIQHGINGYLLERPTVDVLVQQLTTILKHHEAPGLGVSHKRATFVERFSFDHYRYRVMHELVNSPNICP